MYLILFIVENFCLFVYFLPVYQSSPFISYVYPTLKQLQPLTIALNSLALLFSYSSFIQSINKYILKPTCIGTVVGTGGRAVNQINCPRAYVAENQAIPLASFLHSDLTPLREKKLHNSMH